MRQLRRALVPIAVATLALGAVVTAAQTSSATTPAAAPTVYSVTVAGTDAHSIDPHVSPMFRNGGAVQATVENNDVDVTYGTLEAPIDLPVGAKVISVTFTLSVCFVLPVQDAVFVFGSYQPTTGNTVRNFTWKQNTNCNKKTVTKTGNPITTVVAGRRYEVDYNSPTVTFYGNDSGDLFYGATVKYTCTSPCIP